LWRVAFHLLPDYHSHSISLVGSNHAAPSGVKADDQDNRDTKASDHHLPRLWQPQTRGQRLPVSVWRPELQPHLDAGWGVAMRTRYRLYRLTNRSLFIAVLLALRGL
jgi:hypothetical protein